MKGYEPVLDDQFWRAWEAKAKLRGRARARKVWIASGAVLVILAVMGVVYRFLIGS